MLLGTKTFGALRLRTKQRVGSALCLASTRRRVGLEGPGFVERSGLQIHHGRRSWLAGSQDLRCNATVVEASDVSLASGSGGKKESGDQAAVWKAPLDFKFIRDNVEEVEANCRDRNASADPRLVAELYTKYLERNQELAEAQQARNANAKKLKGKMPKEERDVLISDGKGLKEQIAVLEQAVEAVQMELQREGQKVPNMTHPEVPVGGEEQSTTLETVGDKPDFGFAVRDHLELGEKLDLIDFESAADVTGSKFYYLRNEAALLELALVNYSMSKAVSRGFVPMITPDLVRTEVLEKCGFQPRAENTQNYSIAGSDLCLTGTAEIPLGGSVMNSLLEEPALPLKMAGYGRCFRTEAGAAGAASKGLYRVHQFSKVEMFVVCTPEQSDQLHQELIDIEIEMFKELGLHFKVMDMASHDLGAPAYRKFDIEAWMPGMERYGEISSASNCTDYQARRLSIRYRPTAKPGKKKPKNLFVHTLNATACAVPRMIVAILENFQQEDGSVLIPEALQPYMGGMKKMQPKEKDK
ncbi:serine--tRNA ligase [Chloropicon primus]|uniref:serine--tRNA ligase n=1 Tax=Chloropicon primus TaxID=1764295 RepID=A0A5B8MES8_9CHLO|nr:serine--tRNA ligase [Chloropicon primus]UPQ98127.1 serine--tRNA ligase [Chloropicon primus]|mmetsp:Transcript_870/g.2579  ORF Transcript_870/g.2579 Transcript_870/m.2579 type:complete len:527 (+) Transcript_870:222-1802(+)|eukprot:QDZ18919.1 serine--tRNA ligase [Chloropicon primus]